MIQTLKVNFGKYEGMGLGEKTDLVDCLAKFIVMRGESL
jgi:hypothetical protein